MLTYLVFSESRGRREEEEERLERRGGWKEGGGDFKSFCGFWD